MTVINASHLFLKRMQGIRYTPCVREAWSHYCPHALPNQGAIVCMIDRYCHRCGAVRPDPAA